MYYVRYDRCIFKIQPTFRRPLWNRVVSYRKISRTYTRKTIHYSYTTRILRTLNSIRNRRQHIQSHLAHHYSYIPTYNLNANKTPETRCGCLLCERNNNANNKISNKVFSYYSPLRRCARTRSLFEIARHVILFRLASFLPSYCSSRNSRMRKYALKID